MPPVAGVGDRTASGSFGPTLAIAGGRRLWLKP